MKYAAFEELNTEHLRLRKLRTSDATCYYNRLGSNREVTRYMLWQPHKSLQESRESIDKVLNGYALGNTYTWAIVLPENDTIIGRIDLLRIDESQSSCSFAYMIGREFWGRGYGTESLKAVLAFAFDKMEMKTIIADHICANIASGKVMQKAGMQFVRKHSSKYVKDGKIFDADEYMISSEVWKHV